MALNNPSALKFNGATSINLGNPSHLSLTHNTTIEMWIKIDNLSDRRNPFSKAYGGEGTITIETNGTVGYFYGTAGADANPYQSFVMSSALKVGVWTHLAVVRDLDNKTLKWYKDGALVLQSTALYGAAKASTKNVQIGAGYVANFMGSMDELRVWAVPRTEEEIKEGMYTKLHGTEEGLVGYWDFDEAGGTTVEDTSVYALKSSVASPTWVDGEIDLKTLFDILPDEDSATVPRGTDYSYSFYVEPPKLPRGSKAYDMELTAGVDKLTVREHALDLSAWVSINKLEVK